MKTFQSQICAYLHFKRVYQNRENALISRSMQIQMQSILYWHNVSQISCFTELFEIHVHHQEWEREREKKSECKWNHWILSNCKCFEWNQFSVEWHPRCSAIKQVIRQMKNLFFLVINECLFSIWFSWCWHNRKFGLLEKHSELLV